MRSSFVVKIKMAENKTTSGPINKIATATSHPQTAASTANSVATTSADTRVRTAGASLGEFMSQLEDYTPTVQSTNTKYILLFGYVIQHKHKELLGGFIYLGL